MSAFSAGEIENEHIRVRVTRLKVERQQNAIGFFSTFFFPRWKKQVSSIIVSLPRTSGDTPKGTITDL